jgi:hypothetical protein
MPTKDLFFLFFMPSHNFFDTLYKIPDFPGTRKDQIYRDACFSILLSADSQEIRSSTVTGKIEIEFPTL